MKWDQSFTKKFTIMNHSKLLKNLKKELIKYPITRDKIKKNPSQDCIFKIQKVDDFWLL